MTNQALELVAKECIDRIWVDVVCFIQKFKQLDFSPVVDLSRDYGSTYACYPFENRKGPAE